MSVANASPVTDGSKLDRIRDAWEKAGGKDPNKNEAEKMLKAYRDAKSKMETKQRELESAEEAHAAEVLRLANAYGAKSLKIDGQVVHFACRGEKVFFKSAGADIVDLS